jgi:hypothetical protein
MSTVFRDAGAILIRWPLLSLLFSLGYALGRSLAGTIYPNGEFPFSFDGFFVAVAFYYAILGVVIGLLLSGVLIILVSTRIWEPWSGKLARLSIPKFGILAPVVGLAAGVAASALLGPLHAPDS